MYAGITHKAANSFWTPHSRAVKCVLVISLFNRLIHFFGKGDLAPWNYVTVEGVLGYLQVRLPLAEPKQSQFQDCALSLFRSLGEAAHENVREA